MQHSTPSHLRYHFRSKSGPGEYCVLIPTNGAKRPPCGGTRRLHDRERADTVRLERVFFGSRQIIPYFAKRSFLRHLENRLKKKITVVNSVSGRRRYHSVFCSFFRHTHIGRTDGWTLDRLKLQILNKKRRRCAPAQISRLSFV